MKTVIIISALVLVVAYLAHTTISLHPFKITLDRPYAALGFIFLLLALVFAAIDNQNVGYKNGFKNGYKSGINDSIEIIKKFKNEQ